SIYRAPISLVSLLFLTTRHPPGPPLFPSTTLFRSSGRASTANRKCSALPSSATGPCTMPVGCGTRQPASGSWRVAESSRHRRSRSEEHTSELQSRENLVCRLLLEKKNVKNASDRCT